MVSSTLTGADPEVTIVAGDPAALVRDLKQQDGMGIWLAGGGKLAAALIDQIDELVIKRYSIVIGSGIPLFDGPFAPATFVPAATSSFDSGLAITTYTRT